MVPIPGGSFYFQGEVPVTIKDFHLCRAPVTVRQYMFFVKETNSHYPEWLEPGSVYHVETGSNDLYSRLGSALTNPDYPVVGISWHDADAFCRWLSGKEGKDYRLPSETEWEYAARGGRQQRGLQFAGSNKLKEVGWYRENSNRGTHKPGLKLPNELGLVDMSGNVWEWCADHWHDNYKDASDDGRAWTTGGYADDRVVRGGSWFNRDDNARVSNPDGNYTNYRDNLIGFRLARS